MAGLLNSYAKHRPIWQGPQKVLSPKGAVPSLDDHGIHMGTQLAAPTNHAELSVELDWGWESCFPTLHMQRTYENHTCQGQAGWVLPVNMKGQKAAHQTKPADYPTWAKASVWALQTLGLWAHTTIWSVWLAWRPASPRWPGPYDNWWPDRIGEVGVVCWGLGPHLQHTPRSLCVLAEKKLFAKWPQRSLLVGLWSYPDRLMLTKVGS